MRSAINETRQAEEPDKQQTLRTLNFSVSLIMTLQTK